MAKRTPVKEKAVKPAKTGPLPVDAGVKKRLDEKDNAKPYEPLPTQKKIAAYVSRRIEEMQDFRKGLNIEQKWREADEEYVPHELDFGTTRKRFETDQDTGLRSRMVPVGDITQQWRQASSAPTLLAKIQTALSIIVDNQPEAELVALVKKYQARTAVAYALWKRNWQITDAKEKLKIVVFNLFKYGWAPERVYPRLVKYDKRILSVKDPANPENDKYDTSELIWFNDVDREPLSPYSTWIDELAVPYDQYSVNESYYEKDYSFDQFMIEFGHYPGAEFVPRNSIMTRNDAQRKSNRTETATDMKQRQDIVTVGFFESRHKDLYVIYIPRHKIVVYNSPLPNDDGYLSVVQTLYLLRNMKVPYGVSLWEIIRQNKALYDKMKNMTMDQLVLSIMKFGFFSGTNPNLGDGKIEIVPGQARQLTSSTGKPEVNWMEIPGPGQEAWKGLEAVSAMMDDESGISPTLEGEVTGKTLGEILHAKEAALKRMKVPVNNIAWFIEQDAYVTLSWMSQLYATPTVKEFVDEAAMVAFERENEIDHQELFQDKDETGQPVGPMKATYLPQLSLHLEDNKGNLTEGKESKFFQVGKDIKTEQIKWRGIFKVLPRSIIDNSQEVNKAVKMGLANMLIPMLGNPNPNAMQLYAKPAKQMVMMQEEDPKDWLPDSWIQYLETGQLPPPPGIPGLPSLQGMGGTAPLQGGAPPGQNGTEPQPIFTANTMKNQTGNTPAEAPKAVPVNEVNNPGQPPQMGQNMFEKRL